MNLKSRINQNRKLKKLVHWLIIVPNQSRPRLWIKCLHRFFHEFKRGAVVRGRLDLFPFNKFQVGHNSIVENYSVINNGVGDVIIGNNTVVGIGSVIIGPVNIGNDVIIAQYVAISGLNHIYDRVDTPISRQGVKTRGISIDDGSWIGANVTIAFGVKIGKNSVIGAGSVVTKDIPDYVVAVGNPAKVIKKFSIDSMQWEAIKEDLSV